MMFNDVLKSIEPEGRQLSEDFPLFGDRVGKNDVKGRQTIGRHHKKMAVEIEHFPNLSPVDPGDSGKIQFGHVGRLLLIHQTILFMPREHSLHGFRL